MSYNGLYNRLRSLEEKYGSSEPEPWPPVEDGSPITWMFYQQLLEAGVQLPAERPEGSILIYLMKEGAKLIDWDSD